MADAPQTLREPSAEDTPPQRYGAALAHEIELRWQDWRTSAPSRRPTRPDRSPTSRRSASVPSCSCSTCSRTRRAPGCTSATRSGYIGTDVYGRYQRMTGHNVLHTMGFDAFGLPAEQYAVADRQHPRDHDRRERRQLPPPAAPPRASATTGAARSSTTDPGYYRWTQWIFLQIFDVAGTTPTPTQRTGAPARSPSWSPSSTPAPGRRPTAGRGRADAGRAGATSSTSTGWPTSPRRRSTGARGWARCVANEEVTADGRSDRGNFPVFKRNMRQWMMRITAYADRLIDDLDLLDWPDSIKTMQRNWIGRSDGRRGATSPSPRRRRSRVFTTRPDTLFGATFMVLAPEHPLRRPTLTTPEQTPTAGRCAATSAQAGGARSDVDRQDERPRRRPACSPARTPSTRSPASTIPIWIADYVLMGYGTGAIMAVPVRRPARLRVRPRVRPADPGDPAAARRVVRRRTASSRRSTRDAGPRRSSATRRTSTRPTTASTSTACRRRGRRRRCTNAWLEANGAGEATVTYKLRDWLFSRQRYWGEPFPIVYDDDGQPARAARRRCCRSSCPRPTSFSPRTFDPDDEFSEPESPLDRLSDWVEVELDLGDGPQALPPRHQHDAAVGRLVLVRAALPRPDQRERASSTRRSSGTGWGRRPTCGPTTPAASTCTSAASSTRCCTCCTPASGTRCCTTSATCRRRAVPRLFNQGYILAAAYTDEREHVRRGRSASTERDGALLLRGRAGHRECGQDGQEPEERRRRPTRCTTTYGADTLRLLRDVHGPARRVAAVGDRATSSACTGSCSGCGATSSTRRPATCVVVDAPADDETRRAAAPHDRRRARRHGAPALQHRDRQADRAQQPPHQAAARHARARSPSRWC